MKIHLGDQTDGKVLLGTYICTDIPGEFKWQPGVLTRAVSEGIWVLIEDIDLAPNDVISILIPLLENRELFIPSRGEKVKASSGFQLFASRTLSLQSNRAFDIGANLWTKVKVEPLSIEELENVASFLYPSLQNSIQKLIEVFKVSLASYSNSAYTSHSRQLSTRDLMKWCFRIQKYFSGNSYLSNDLLEKVLLEALDCFCVMIPKKALREAIAQKIGKSLRVSEEQVRKKKISYFF